jgi:hypothetical protein
MALLQGEIFQPLTFYPLPCDNLYFNQYFRPIVTLLPTHDFTFTMSMNLFVGFWDSF